MPCRQCSLVALDCPQDDRRARLSIVCTLNWREKRRAERILSNAKFYLHATTSTLPLANRARDWAAMQLLTEKILEVRNG